MSDLINNFKNNKIKQLIYAFNKMNNTINNNFNNEIRAINIARINLRQKQLIINIIINKYKQIRNNLKNRFENEMNNIKNIQFEQFNTVQHKSKKALIIGINYKETSNELNGCINDANSIKTYLTEHNFTIKMLTDETPIKPTKINILNEIKELLEKSNKNDTLFIFYSGHGSHTLDRNGDELDGNDELIIPLDFNYIKDDELKTLIDTYGKPDTNIIALFDSCNSGTALDLRYQINDDITKNNITENDKNTETPCNTLLISGCRDDQFSLETMINYKVQGLMTWSFLEVVKNNKEISCINLLKEMRELLKLNSNQIPQLSSGRFCNPDNNFLSYIY
jgi:hypothetical protein